MERKITTWHSPKLNREMSIVSYGWYGKPLLFFPTDMADFLEYERFELIDSLDKQIEAGKIKCYSIDNINKNAWLNEEISREQCGHIQNAYNNYITDEVVPFIRNDCKSPNIRISCTGASLGAFQSCNQVFRRPDLFDNLIALSGTYDLKPYLKGYTDQNCYLNSPMDFVPNLEDEFYLSVLRNHCSLNFLVGQGTYEDPEASRAFCDILKKKRIPHNLDVWGQDVDHDWVWWRKMLPYYCDLLF